MADAVTLACPECGQIQRLPAIASGRLDCRRCGNTLERATGRGLDPALACALATLILLAPANSLILLHVSVAGITEQSHLASGVALLWDRGWVFTAVVVALQAVAFPFLRFGLLAASLAAIRLGRPGRWTGPAFRWAERLDFWAMPDVFLIGFLIGYSRLAPFVPVRVGPGGWCLVGAAFMTMLTRATMDRRMIWRRIAAPPPPGPGAVIGCTACDLLIPAAAEGQPCPRCGQRIWRRAPFSLMRATALVAAGYLLYPVANLYPLSIMSLAGNRTGHTLFSAVQQLVGAGLWPLACVVFITSIAIPLAKLAGMTWLFVSVAQRSNRRLRIKTRLFRIIDAIGRWSNADLFTIVVFMPLIQLDGVAEVRLGIGAPALLAVVVLTMLASSLFDTRLLWDAAGQPAAHVDAHRDRAAMQWRPTAS